MRENPSSNYFKKIEIHLASNSAHKALRELLILRKRINPLNIRLLAKSYFWEALCFYHLRLPLKSQKASKKGIELFESIGDYVEVSKLLRDQGLVFESNGDLNSSLVYLNESISKLRDNDVIDALGITYSKMGQVYYKKNLLTESKYYCELGYQLCKEGKNAFFLVTSILPLSKLYYKTGNYIAGLELIDEGLVLQSKIDNKNGFVNLRRKGELNLRMSLLYLEVNLISKSFSSLKIFIKNCLVTDFERQHFVDDPDIKFLFSYFVKLGYLPKIENFLKQLKLDIKDFETQFEIKLS